MAATQPFIVSFRFATHPILRGECTLDAVLGGEIARRVESREEAMLATPLACTDAVHHGSSLILLGDTGVSRPAPAVANARGAFLAAEPASRRRRSKARDAGLGEERLERVRGARVRGRRLARHGARRRGGVHPLAGPRDRKASRLGLGDDGTWVARDRARGRRPRDLGTRHRTLRPGLRDRADRAEAPASGRSLPAPGRGAARGVVALVRVRQPYYDPGNRPVPAVVPGP